MTSNTKIIIRTVFATQNNPCIIKWRPEKSYRLPALDSKLTRHRCLVEARLLLKCRMVGVPCPALYLVDEANGKLWIEYLNGPSIRQYLKNDIELSESIIVMQKAGESVGKMHSVDVVHGDLTTSNLLVNQEKHHVQVFLIDFGLGSQSNLEEDKAVDLYVLERALTSTHPKAEPLVRN